MNAEQMNTLDLMFPEWCGLSAEETRSVSCSTCWARVGDKCFAKDPDGRRKNMRDESHVARIEMVISIRRLQ